MKLIVKTTYSLLTEYTGTGTQTCADRLPDAVQRQQLRTGCNDLCAASMVSYLTRLLALVRGSALERNRKHLAPNVPKNRLPKMMAAAERKGTYAERNGT